MNIKKQLGFNSLYTYGESINSHDLMKFVAILFMVIDHFGKFFFPETPEFRALGRLAFPIFLFLVGYSGSYRTNYNLLALGLLISILSGLLNSGYLPLDILVSIFVVRIALRYLEEKKLLEGDNLTAIIVTLMMLQLPFVMLFSYGTLGLLFGIAGFLKSREGENPSLYYTCFIVALIIFDYCAQVFVTSNEMRTPVFMAIFSIISLLLLYIFMNYKVKEFKLDNDPARKLVLAISRNALFVYWFHFILFLYISVLFFPELHV